VNGKLYAVGGVKLDKTDAIVEVYNPATNNWTHNSSMSKGRWHPGVGVLYAVGGNAGRWGVGHGVGLS
jgi:hypothetical protein